MTSYQAACIFVAIFAMVLIYGYVMYRKGFKDAVDQYEDHLNVMMQELDDKLEERRAERYGENGSNFYSYHNRR